MNLNKVIIAGRVTQTPEKRTSQSGVSITTFSVATNNKTKDKETTEFHNVVSFSGTAEAVAKYIIKGQEILVEGRLQTSSWEKDGVKKHKTEIIAERVEFGSKPANNNTTTQQATTNNNEDIEEINIAEIPF
ncbi:MAG: single-stranded DNA-binding protein [Patescibacteria group bacterium]|jgi:single-strand DNA-binding protein|nr:single-stranded DNA-binding protein [Patescibacteria group bacterium]